MTDNIYVVAVMETTSYTFTALARTEQEAGEAIARAWRHHGDEIDGLTGRPVELVPPAGSSSDRLDEEWGVRYVHLELGGFHVY